MGTHNDFRSSAETRVKSPQHFKLDTRLLGPQIQTAVLQYVQKKGNDPLNWGFTEAVPPNPWASHYKLQEFVDSLWAIQWPASTHMVIHKANHLSERVSTITRQKAVTGHDSVTSYRS